MAHFLAGCSFTDPRWQSHIPWSVQYSQIYDSYIVAQCGMGIRGISTEALSSLKQLTDVDKVILMLPTIWRMDIEIDHESPGELCNSMVDTLWASKGQWNKFIPAERKWMISGGLNFEKLSKRGLIFDLLYRYQGFLVMLKEQMRSLRMFLDYCNHRQIPYYITAIQDPNEQRQGLEYVSDQINELLHEVEYDKWIRFNGKFVDKFLGTDEHPTTDQHKLICEHILQLTSKNK